MKKERKPRRLLLALSIVSTVVATSAAVYYRRQLDEHNPNLLVLEPHPEQMAQIKDGSGTLTYWTDETGGTHYTVTDRPA